ncbi:MAG: hypothetical protein V7719_15025 [Psychroserpens sp.]|uniref:hypothetical protein n=1 Tax=Psychroserpens sp. TaxID=2020870 RepID=UPI003002C209
MRRREVKDESSILYYTDNQFNKDEAELKFIVNELPQYIAIDPFGTRSDENFTDNLLSL